MLTDPLDYGHPVGHLYRSMSGPRNQGGSFDSLKRSFRRTRFHRVLSVRTHSSFTSLGIYFSACFSFLIAFHCSTNYIRDVYELKFG